MTKEDVQRMLFEGTLEWSHLVEFVAEWIGENVVGEPFGWDKDVPDLCHSYHRQWREEMMP